MRVCSQKFPVGFVARPGGIADDSTVSDDIALIGLTGGLGSGKSTVAALIAETGVPTLDADHLARTVVEPGQPAHAEIAAAWPDVIGRDGGIDRRRLGGIVFHDPKARARLEAITHPRIRRLLHEKAADLARAGHRFLIYEASLLVEAGRLNEFAALIVVDAPEDVRIRRAVARGKQTEADIRARMAAQCSSEERLRAATHVIDNAGDLAQTREQVQNLVAELRRRFT